MTNRRTESEPDDGDVADDSHERVERVSLSNLLESVRLDRTWQQLRKQLRAVGLRQFVLVRDPLEWAALEWDWANARDRLVSSIYQGRYRPSPALEVRGGKTRGLTRVHSFLSVEDQLLLLATINATREVLVARIATWAHADIGESESVSLEIGDSEPYGGSVAWWYQWLATREAIRNILGEKPLIVVTDVTNCFPSIRLETLRNRLAVASNLDHEVLDLLETVISGTAPTVKAGSQSAAGLPIDPHDCSRPLAHFLLTAVDDEFEAEGEQNLYARYVDDVAFGADDESDAMAKLGRFQLALEKIGLYPNTAKTTWYSPEEYEIEYCMVDNNSVGEIERLVLGGDLEMAKTEMASFLPDFLANEGGRGWEQVLRRACTQARKAGCRDLIEHLPGLLWRYPSSARQLLEYRLSFSLGGDEAERLIEKYWASEGTYEDTDALLLEALAMMPISPDASDSVRDLGEAVLKQEYQRRPVVAAAAIAVLAKGSTDTELSGLDGWAMSILPSSGDSIAFRTLTALLHVRLGGDDIEKVARRRSTEMARIFDFLDAIRSDGAARSIALKLVRLVPKKEPDRLLARPRSLLLIPELSRSGAPEWRRRSDAEKAAYEPQRGLHGDPWLEQRWEWTF